MKRGYRRTSKQIYKGFFRLLFAAMMVMVIIGGIDDLNKGFISMKRIAWASINTFTGDPYSSGQNASEILYYRQSPSSPMKNIDLTSVTLAIIVKSDHTKSDTMKDALIVIKSALIFSKDVDLRVIIFVDDDDGDDDGVMNQTEILRQMNEKLLEYSVTALHLGLTFQYKFANTAISRVNSASAECENFALWKWFNLESTLKETDTVIWLDAENLFLSSVKDVWKIFGLMDPNQFIGFVDSSKFSSSNIGIGTTFLNLTRMRSFEFHEKVDAICKKYGGNQSFLDDHDGGSTVMGKFLEENPGTFCKISCAFTYRKNYCSGPCHHNEKGDADANGHDPGGKWCRQCEDAEKNGVAIITNGDGTGFRDCLPLKIIRDHFSAFDLATGSPWRLLDRIRADLNFLRPTMNRNPCLKAEIYGGKLLKKFEHYLLTQLNNELT